jgi:hypothetical protein
MMDEVLALTLSDAVSPPDGEASQRWDLLTGNTTRRGPDASCSPTHRNLGVTSKAKELIHGDGLTKPALAGSCNRLLPRKHCRYYVFGVNQ